MADITVTEHLLLHQKRSPQATGQFTGLLYDLILSGKTISRRINKAGLLDILGGTGEVNVQGENVQKMDSIANRILLYRMERCGALCAMGSEEEPELVRVGPEFPRGDYILIFDPLDGSSNIDVNINVGTIFSILRRPAGSTGEVSLEEVLQPGIQQVADFHRTLLYGGIYLYPPDKNKPNGKLRMMCEAAPLAFLAEQAGGKASDGRRRILERRPETLHARTPLYIGSARDVEAVEAIYAKYPD